MDNGEIDTLTVQVDWRKGGKQQWTYYHCCLLLPSDQKATPPADKSTQAIKIGDKVRVKRTVLTPRCVGGCGRDSGDFDSRVFLVAIDTSGARSATTVWVLW